MCFEEVQLKTAFQDEAITEEHQQDIQAYLRILKLRDESTYRHSIRVGILCEKIAQAAQVAGITPKTLLWAGLLHDIGKTLIPSAVLTKKACFTTEDYAAIEPHVMYGWGMLSQIHDYTAHIIVRHHRFGPHPYPAVLPPLPAHLQPHEAVIHEAARLLALADYFDAITNRENNKFGSPLTGQQKRDQYYGDNSDRFTLIVTLETSGVLGF